MPYKDRDNDQVGTVNREGFLELCNCKIKYLNGKQSTEQLPVRLPIAGASR